MNGYLRFAKCALYAVYLCIALLIVSAVALPFIVTWYVEVKGRDQTLPAIIMLTCYPCLPFGVMILSSFKKLLKNILGDLILGDKNLNLLRISIVSFFAITAITLGAGRLYKPFLFIAGGALFCAVTLLIVKSIFFALLYKQREKDLEDIKENL